MIKFSKKNLTLATIVSAISVFFPIVANANIIHSHSVSFPLGTGINYEQSRRITRNGLVDVHILTVDLNATGVTVGPALPEHGGRGSTTALLQNSGAVAGINADFFNLARYPGTSYGQVIQNGQILQLINQAGYAATFGIDINNTPFIQYLQPEIGFVNGGWQTLNIRDINKITGNIIASVFDRNAIYSTSGIDSRQEGLVKIVVDNGYITYISYPGELVHVPENGFIVVLSESYAYYRLNYIHVGQPAHLDIRPDLNNIWNAIGGGGQILRNGQPVSGWAPGPNARHPRSAVGISQDGNTIFLINVDGRNHSIGATHAEMSAILLEIGAFNAMHLDGGASTTMGIRTPGTSNLIVANSPSDGTQRRVTNALGVFNNAPVGVITDLTIETFPRDQVFAGDVLHLYPFGLDNHLNLIELTDEYELTPWASIERVGNMISPTVPGLLDIGLSYFNFGTMISIPVLELAEIVPNHRTLEMNTGNRVNLTFTGLSPRGHRGPLNRVEVNVIPVEAGSFENGVFIAGTESGVIQARVGGITTYIGVNVNQQGHNIHPVGNVARNPYRGMIDIMGAGFDITVVGNTSLGEFLYSDEMIHFIDARNNALSNFTRGSDLGVFAGPSELNNVENFSTINWTQGYSIQHVNNNTAIISLNASSGSITATSVNNWNFIYDIERYNPNHVIFLLNRPIANLPAYERQMLSYVIESMATYRDVFVVSSQGFATTNTIQNGVTHINLGSLFYEYGINPSFNILRFRITPGGIEFDIHT